MTRAMLMAHLTACLLLFPYLFGLWRIREMCGVPPSPDANYMLAILALVLAYGTGIGGFALYLRWDRHMYFKKMCAQWRAEDKAAGWLD